MHWGLVVCALYSLLLGSYFDNIRGPLLPILGKVFAIDYSKQSLFLVLGNFAAVISNLLLLRWLGTVGERKVSIGICVFSVAVCIAARWVNGYAALCLYAIGLGMVIAALGAISNVLLIQGTDLSRRSRLFCALHMMYGFGSFLGPLSVSLLYFQRQTTWQATLFLGIPFVLVMLAMFAKEVRPDALINPQPKTANTLSRVQVVILLCFGIYVVGEVLTSMWMVSYLVSTGIEESQANRYASLFFIAMGVSRLFCFFSFKAEQEVFFIVGSLLLAVFFALLGHFGHPWAFSLVGVFGPYFPLFIARVSRTFPEQASKMTIWILGFIQLSLAFAHLTLGKLSDTIGIQSAYWVPPAFLLMTVGLFLYYLLLEKGFTQSRRRVRPH